MSKEKTMEELEAELEAAKKENLERKLKVETAKIELAKKEEEEKANQKLREELKEEVRNEMLAKETTESKIDKKEDKQTLEGTNSEWETFTENYKKEHELKGVSYEDYAKSVSKGGFKGKR